MRHCFHPTATEPSAAVTDHAALIDGIVTRARAASRAMATVPAKRKNRALRAMAEIFRANAQAIIAENERDLKAGIEAGLAPAMVDRLRIDAKGVEGMAQGLEKVATLDDPVGEVVGMKTLENGIQLGQMRAPIGVIGIIYESRPNVTADAGALCLKSGNAVILRGGKEAIHSNRVLAGLMQDACKQAGLPEGCIQLIPTTDRAAVGELLRRNDCVDVIIPRGGKSLIKAVMEQATMPVIKHLDGNCFVYLDKTASPIEAMAITLNSKTQRTGVCNAAESLLIHKDIAAGVGLDVVKALIEKGVEVRADERLRALMPELKLATVEDWDEEFLDMIITAGIVDSLEEAMEFINVHGSHHTETIVTRDHPSAMKFLAGIDSACVFINCSTRFSDGGQFEMGCEIGISTDKIHARGPMGLKELTTLKFIAFGQGQVRE